MLYGISTSFPVLSRLERQVAHALLTRPPLSKLKQASICSVRLECVMHAASVHPEPGSNSRLKSLYLSYLLIYCSHLGIVEILGCQVSLASFLYSFSYFRTLYSLSIVVQFSRIISRPPEPLPFLRALDYYITFIYLCQHFFSHFFTFVQKAHTMIKNSRCFEHLKQLRYKTSA